jgi:hypothetical protein
MLIVYHVLLQTVVHIPDLDRCAVMCAKVGHLPKVVSISVFDAAWYGVGPKVGGVDALTGRVPCFDGGGIVERGPESQPRFRINITNLGNVGARCTIFIQKQPYDVPKRLEGLICDSFSQAGET